MPRCAKRSKLTLQWLEKSIINLIGDRPCSIYAPSWVLDSIDPTRRRGVVHLENHERYIQRYSQISDYIWILYNDVGVDHPYLMQEDKIDVSRFYPAYVRGLQNQASASQAGVVRQPAARRRRPVRRALVEGAYPAWRGVSQTASSGPITYGDITRAYRMFVSDEPRANARINNVGDISIASDE